MALLDAKQAKPLHGGPSYSLGHRMFRAVWNVAWLVLAAWTPASLHRWRVWLLNRFGAQVHPTAHVYGSARVWYPPNLAMEARSCLGPRVNCYCMAAIKIGRGTIVSQGAHLCAGMHDIEDPEFQLLAKPIELGDGSWIAAEAFLGPGVTVGRSAVVGARAVLFKDALPHGIYAGNPAQLLRQRALRQEAGRRDG